MWEVRAQLVSMSPMSFVPVAGPVDDQQRCSASSLVLARDEPAESPRSPPRQSANGPQPSSARESVKSFPWARACWLVVSSCAFPSLKDDGLGQNLLIPPCPLQQCCSETFRFSFAPRSVVRRGRVVFRCVLCQKSFSPHHRSLSRVVEEQLQMRGFDYPDKKKRCALWSSVMADSASRTWS